MTRGLRGSDVPFLTRRVRDAAAAAPAAPVLAPPQASPAPQAGAAQPASPAPQAGGNLLDLSGRASLDLSGQASAPPRTPAGAPTPAAAQQPHERLYPAPMLGELRQLTPGSAVVRLNPRQAGIGSMFVLGSRGTAWEGTDGTTGAESIHREHIGTPIPTAGNRPLVGFVNRDAVIVLRHVRALRRALFIAAGGPMAVQTFDGSAVAVQGTLGPGQRTVLTASRIGSVLELRAESVPEDWDDGQIWREFAFTMTVGVGAPRR